MGRRFDGLLRTNKSEDLWWTVQSKKLGVSKQGVIKKEGKGL